MELQNAQAKHEREMNDILDKKQQEFEQLKKKAVSDIANRERERDIAMKQNDKVKAEEYNRQVSGTTVITILDVSVESIFRRTTEEEQCRGR